MIQRCFAILTSGLSLVSGGNVDTQYLLGSASPRGHSINNHSFGRAAPPAGEWLVIMWPRGEAGPSKNWVWTVAAGNKLKTLVKMAKHRWIVERDYEELKQELGLGHYEGRGWRGFHHHATLCIAAYGFLIAERTRFSPSARVGNVRLSAPEPPPDFRPRG